MTDLELAELRGTLTALVSFPTSSSIDKRVQADLIPGVVTLIDELQEARARVAKLENDYLHTLIKHFEQIEKMTYRVEELEREMRVAAGMLSTHPQFSHKHPQEVLAYIVDAAKEGKG